MIRELSLQEMQEIYDTKMKGDFPPAEIKPFSTIRAMHERGEYLGLGMLTAEGGILAYAFFVICRPDGQAVLLDYFAVDKDRRGEGIGSRMLREIIERFADIPVLLESEDPDHACDEADRKKREKRLSFYHRNNALDTGVRAWVFDVDYRVLPHMPPGRVPAEAYARKILSELYGTMFSPQQLEIKVRVDGKSLLANN